MGHELFFQKTLFFAIVGLGLEVIFTGVTTSVLRVFQMAESQFNGHLSRNIFMMGHSSPLYLFSYSFAYPVMFYLDRAGAFTFPWFFRYLLYMVLFIVLEFTTMFCLNVILKTTPSKPFYEKSKFNIRGYTRLDFAPAYGIAGFTYEFIYRFLLA